MVQDLGPYTLAATINPPTALPGAVSVQIAPQQSFSGLVSVTLWLVPIGAPSPTPPPARVISEQGSGAMVVRLRRRMSPRINELLTSSMALCALIALVAFVATQLIPANVTLSLSGSPTSIVPPTP